MAQHNTLEVCRVDLFTVQDELEKRYPAVIVAAVLDCDQGAAHP